MSTTGGSSNDQLEDIRRRLADDAAFRSAAGADLAGTLRNAGLDDEQLSRFAISDSDEHGNKGMGLRTETWICEIGEGSKRCWCVTCPIA